MADARHTCGKCFAPEARLSQSNPLAKHEALGLVRALIAQGIHPMLCQWQDEDFRVCHETRAAAAQPAAAAQRRPVAELVAG